jgi:hypothetical protein
MKIEHLYIKLILIYQNILGFPISNNSYKQISFGRYDEHSNNKGLCLHYIPRIGLITILKTEKR